MLRPSIHINPARGQVSATPQFQTHQAAHRGGPAWPQARRGPPQRRPQPHGHPDPATDPKCPRSLAPRLESVGPGQAQHRGAPVPGASGMCPHARSPANPSPGPPVDAPAPQSCWTGGGQHLDCVLWRRLSSVIPASCLGQIPPRPGRGHVLAGATGCVARMEPVSGQQAPGSPTKVLLPNLRPRHQHHVAGNMVPHSEHAATPK